ncbi:MAG: DUF2147 domain-containing protein [Bacteroidia bacterium]|nr:DUF2147 domain-containing protein [Bacteroidia bacterium]
MKPMMKMRTGFKASVWVLLLCLGPLLGWAQSPIGRWKTIDDVTGKQKSYVEITERNGKLYGKIVQLFREPGEDPDPVCDKCGTSDSRRNQKVLGMEILQGLYKVSSTKWEGGKILDPKNGSVYDCYIEMQGNDKMMLRGFMGVSFLGRTQYWYRVP